MLPLTERLMISGVTQAAHADFPEVRAKPIDISCSNLPRDWTVGGMAATVGDLVLYGMAVRDCGFSIEKHERHDSLEPGRRPT